VSAKAGDKSLATARIRNLLKRFFDSQEAIRELLAFAVDQGDVLDSDEAAAKRLAKIAMPSDVAPEVAAGVYRAAKEYLDGQRRAFVGGRAKEKSAIKDGMDPEIARKTYDEDWSKAYESSLKILRARLHELDISASGVMAIHRYIHRQTRRPRLPVLLDSLLMTSVNDFENFFAGLAKASYAFQPQVLRESSKTYSWADVAAYESIDEFTEYAIDEQVDRLMREGLDEWMKFVSKATRIQPDNLKRCSDPVAEVLQRRHIITHNGGRASRTYLERTKGVAGAGTKLGQQLPVNRQYLNDALDRFALLATAIGAASTAAVERTGGNSKGRSSYFIGDLIVDLLKLERYSCVAPLMEILSDQMPDAASVETLRVNSWIARSRIEGPQSIRPEVEKWDVSNLDGRFRLAKMALMENLGAAKILANQLVTQGALSPHDLATWPLLEPLRNYIAKMALAGKTAPAKKATTGKTAPAKKATTGKTAPAKKATTGKTAPAKKATTGKTAPAKKATTGKTAPAKKATTSI
jgi:hypothetical protein